MDIKKIRTDGLGGVGPGLPVGGPGPKRTIDLQRMLHSDAFYICEFRSNENLRPLTEQFLSLEIPGTKEIKKKFMNMTDEEIIGKAEEYMNGMFERHIPYSTNIPKNLYELVVHPEESFSTPQIMVSLLAGYSLHTTLVSKKKPAAPEQSKQIFKAYEQMHILLEALALISKKYDFSSFARSMIEVKYPIFKKVKMEPADVAKKTNPLAIHNIVRELRGLSPEKVPAYDSIRIEQKSPDRLEITLRSKGKFMYSFDTDILGRS